tara:strand:+ start:57 stop:248 length:192 start_codon:yes stop_codon:yes gene_type:complete
MANTSTMNRLEELGRIDAEKAYTTKGRYNLAAEKRRVVGEIQQARTWIAKKHTNGTRKLRPSI